jgi:hypothetical protein
VVLLGACCGGSLGCIACCENGFGQFGVAFVVDEGLADAGEVAHILDGEWGAGLDQFSEGLADALLAVGALARAVCDRLDGAAALARLARHYLSVSPLFGC